ncbi:MAG: LON peptidase substrate-binding domain-containing protein [Nitriliruptoraceae bacterium]
MPDLPMFPLPTVLLPHKVLPLHVFEPRYRALMHDVVEDTGEFGITLITRSADRPADEQRAAVGTLARIVQAEELEDGRWLLVTVGTRRFQVTRWLDDAPYPRADVMWLTDEPVTAQDRREIDEITPILARVLQLQERLRMRSDDRSTHADVDDSHSSAVLADLSPVADPQVAGWQPLVLSPLNPFDSQQILEAGRWEKRLTILREALDDVEMALLFQLSTD